MANQDLTALANLATITTDDIIYVVDDPATAKNPRKATITTLLNVIHANTASTDLTDTAVIARNTNKLDFFAATTSAELKTVISDETGTGALVFGTSPTLVTPALGTPASGILTSCTGLPLTTGITGILASVNMDADTAHLGVTQTFSGAKTFTLKTIHNAGSDMVGFNVDNIQNLIHDQSVSGVDIDFLEDEVQTISIAVNTTFTTANRAIGKSKTLKIVTDATLRTLTFPAWKFIGTKPVDQAASKTGVLTVTCFGTADTDIVAAYAVEA